MLRQAVEKDRTGYVTSQYQKANAFMATGCYDLAQGLYNRLVILHKTGKYLDQDILADTLHNLGMIAENRQQYNQAINLYEQAVALRKERNMTWLFLAKLYFERYEREKAAPDYQAGLAALRQVETASANYPVIGFLKRKYAIV